MITLVTGNPDKKKEFEAILVGVQFDTHALDIPEIQSMNLRDIAEAKVRAAYAQLRRPVVIEDVSFELECLNGFPGPFVKWFAKIVGYETALLVAEKTGKWGATAVSGAAYCDGNRVIYAEGTVVGTLAPRAGEEGWGFDFYFIPEGQNKTMAQLGIETKNKLSHRARGLLALKAALTDAGVL